MNAQPTLFDKPLPFAGKNHDTQIKEINDVIRVAKEKEASVIMKRNARYLGETA